MWNQTIVVNAVTVALSAALGCSAADQGTTGDEQDITSRNAAIGSAVEADVREHAKDRVVTKIQDALDTLTSDKSEQASVQKAIESAAPAGASSPYYGDVTVKGVKYIWADFETDEGEGPTQTGTTFVFDVKGVRVISKSWTGSHGY
jgi:hypothetical protein